MTSGLPSCSSTERSAPRKSPLRFRVTSATVTETLPSPSAMAGQTSLGKPVRPRRETRRPATLPPGGLMFTSTRDITRSQWVLAVALSLLAAATLVYGTEVGVRMPAGAAALILGLLGILIATHSFVVCRARLRAGGGFSRLGSAIFGAGILIAVVLPGVQLVLNTRRSRLEDNGFP